MAANPNFVPAVGSSRYRNIDFTPPVDVIANAMDALDAWENDDLFDRGLQSETDVARCRAFAEGRILSQEDLRVSLAWFRNNESTIRNNPSWETDGRNWQNWMGRGGEAGLEWLIRVDREMTAQDNEWKQSVFFPPTISSYAKLATPVVETDENSYYDYLLNSLLIGLFSTLVAVLLGTSTAYGFSRFKIPGGKDWLFFILSTRFLPPLAVVVPILLMYRQFDLPDTHLGLIILYTAFNLSLAVWLMKGFIDDIPRSYEEAALVDGYSRIAAFRKIILPQAMTGMAVTAVFCLISAWNEYGFAMILNGHGAKTVPVFFLGLQGGVEGIPWNTVSAGSLMFVVPMVVFTIIVRRHLLRGVTFGTVKQ